MIVVDASVAVKWFLPEAGEEAAQQVLTSGEELTAPALIRVEVAAAITRRARQKQISREEAADAVALWLELLGRGVVTLAGDEVDLTEAVALALELDHPLQDCLYLALAQRLKATFITADQKLAAKGSASHPKTRLLSGGKI